MNKSGYAGNFQAAVPVTIANGAQNSSVIELNGFQLAGIQMPAAFTGTTITFLVATTLAGTYQALYNLTGAVSYAVGASRFVAIDPKDFQGTPYIKLVSGSAEGAARSFTVALKG